MKLTIKKLEKEKAKTHIEGVINDWTYFGKKIVAENVFEQGEFYAIVPDDITEERKYQFKHGGFFISESDVIHSSKDISINFVSYYLKANNNGLLLIEDFLSSPSDGWLRKHDVKYHIANDTVVYLLGAGNSKEKVEECYGLGSEYPFMPFLSNCDIELSSINKNIPEEYLKAILNGIEVVFYEIYDGESFMFWVKNSCVQYVE